MGIYGHVGSKVYRYRWVHRWVYRDKYRSVHTYIDKYRIGVHMGGCR